MRGDKGKYKKMEKKKVPIPLPVIVMKEGKWFVASCPILDIATQGKTEEEVKENMEDLINEYLTDPDTPKPKMQAMMAISVSMVTIKVPKRIVYGKTQTVTST